MMNGATNHLWQSTVFAVAATALAFVLRKNSARIRFAIWFTASIKFLIPFSLLISAGGVLQKTPHIRVIMPPAVSLRMMEIAAAVPRGRSGSASIAPARRLETCRLSGSLELRVLRDYSHANSKVVTCARGDARR